MDNLVGNKNLSNGFGIGLWILAPLLFSFIFRGFKKNEWKDIGLKIYFKSNIFLYIIAFFLPIIISIILILLGFFTKSFEQETISTLNISQVIPLLLPLIIGNIIKNIFEEFGWRGYLVPKIFKVVKNDFIGHFIINLVWGCWHLPYWLFFINKVDFIKFTSENIITYIIFGIISILFMGIIYNELRLITNSIWPSYILHVTVNIISAFFIFNGLIKYKQTYELLFGINGIIFVIILTGIGLLLYNYRKKHAPNYT